MSCIKTIITISLIKLNNTWCKMFKTINRKCFSNKQHNTDSKLFLQAGKQQWQFYKDFLLLEQRSGWGCGLVYEDVVCYALFWLRVFHVSENTMFDEVSCQQIKGGSGTVGFTDVKVVLLHSMELSKTRV